MEGAWWSDDGDVIAALSSVVPLSRIPAAGGPPQSFTKMGSGEISHRWPQVLPGGRAVLFTATASPTGADNAKIEAISPATGEVRTLLRGGYYARYLPSGHLVYVHQGTLFGVKFDPARLEVRGTPVPLLNDLAANPVEGGGHFSFSNTGTFIYAAGKNAARGWQLAWLDQSGKIETCVSTPGLYGDPRISPDGRKIAFLDAESTIRIYDLDRGIETRLTLARDSDLPGWAPDSKHVFFKSGNGVFWSRSDGAGDPQKLFESTDSPRPYDYSVAAKRLAYHVVNSNTGADIWTVPLDLTDPDHPKLGKPEPYIQAPYDQLVPEFSPDGHWIVYRSTESGRPEIYVQPFPAAGRGKWQISTDGGLYGFWSNKGNKLFYETTDSRIMVLDYKVVGDTFVPGKPQPWSVKSDKQLPYAGLLNLDLAPDDKRFLVFSVPESAPGAQGSVHVTMLLNFFDELKRRIQ